MVKTFEKASAWNQFFTKESLLDAYQLMLRMRRFEERAGALYTQRSIGGYCHLYIGQEAVVTGIQTAQKSQDTVITAYRDHAHMLACGIDPKPIMAELTGRSAGCSEGKGGSMHMFSKEKKFFGGHGIVGGQVPIGTGLAMGHKYNKDQGVCVTYMGDGAINQGQIYESFNMAALWSLPALYVLEDNQYAMGTAVKRHAAGSLVERGTPYGIEGCVVNGQDVLVVREAAEWALTIVRNESRPVLMHVKTYRYRGHSMSDPGLYRSKDEVEDFKTNHDPLLNLQKVLLEQKLISVEELTAWDDRIKTEMKDAADFALDAPLPEESKLYTDVVRACARIK